MKTSVEVEIYGATYTMKSDSNAEYTRKLAKFADQKMREAGETSQTVSTQKIAVLALMNIADALFKLKKNNSEQVLKEIEQKTEKLSRMIDECNVNDYP